MINFTPTLHSHIPLPYVLNFAVPRLLGLLAEFSTSPSFLQAASAVLCHSRHRSLISCLPLLKSLLSFRGWLRMTASSTGLLNVVVFVCSFLNEKMGRVIISLNSFLTAHCTEIP